MAGEWKERRCEVCGSDAWGQIFYNESAVFYSCPVCGRYELTCGDVSLKRIDFDWNQLSSFLVYNSYKAIESERRYYTNRKKEWCDKWREEFNKGNIEHGCPIHLTKEDVNNWYPKSFSEKIDAILLYLNDKVRHVGEEATLNREEAYSVLFVDRYDDSMGNRIDRKENDQGRQAKYMLDYLVSRNYIQCNQAATWWNDGKEIALSLLPDGYARIDQLQKNTSNGKNVLVAMKFGEETKNLREAIREGIREANYLAVFIDEVQHNDFITPELLKYIKNSKFVVVDLTHQNNGAYFEEGYAMGLGKPVIQLCKKGVRLHFDIAQKNTIMWESESDIPRQLKNRIDATID